MIKKKKLHRKLINNKPVRYRRGLLNKVQLLAQEYARLRDCGGRSGGAYCISCGKYRTFKDLDGGHFISKTSSAIRFDERNINAQCRKCNRFLDGNQRHYYHGMVKKYGHKVVSELESKEHLTRKWDSFELEELFRYFTQKIAEYK
jgi:hypothetical protein